MSFLPSSVAVSEMLAVLKTEKDKTKADFHSAVFVASIKWEAELLLALQEFREAGGFVGFQDEVRSSILAERRAERRVDLLAEGLVECRRAVSDKTTSLDEPCHWSFLHDGFDVKTGLQTVSDRTVVVRHGDPTMATERAALRVRILAAVKKEIREAITAKLDEDLKGQDARNREFANVQYRLAREKQMAIARTLCP